MVPVFRSTRLEDNTHTHFACSLAKPLWAFIDEEILGKRELSSGLRSKFASVRRARLKV